MNPEKVGQLIKKLREEKELTQEKLSEELSVTRGAVSKWETGRRIPDISMFPIIADFFKITSDDLLAGEVNHKDDIALKMYKDRTKFKKGLIISFIIILVLIASFFIYYFINQYNSVKVYTISSLGNAFEINNGLVIKTNEKMYFNLGEIVSKKDVTINKLELYYMKDEEEKIISSTNEHSILFYDYSEYEEYLKFDNINETLDRLYLKIYYDNNFENVKLILIEDYTNSNIFFGVKRNKESNQTYDNKQNNNLSEQIEKCFQKRNDDYFIEEHTNSKKIIATFIPEVLILNIFIKYKNIEEHYIYNIRDEVTDYYYNNGVKEYNISYDIDNNCISNNCENINIFKINESKNKIIQKLIKCS